MKITAEFNSVEEILQFANRLLPDKTMVEIPKTVMEIPEIEELIEEIEDMAVEVEAAAEIEAEKELEPEEPKEVTKEMVRALFTTLLKANRQKEAKALTTKYGASKLTELKTEDYAAVYKEASELLEEGIA
jgi:hypothetical protein